MITIVTLTDATLARADLIRADLTRADLTGAELTDVRWPEGAQVPEGWSAEGDSGRLRRADQLSEIMPHYLG
jgi:uncharacterized protein YjbI with pentapeptide repeats